MDGGAGTLRVLWRWSCAQLAEQVGAGAKQAGGGLYEAAIYAALSSHLARCVCPGGCGQQSAVRKRKEGDGGELNWHAVSG